MELHRVEVVVLGGGPAGAVTAGLLSRAGVDVVVLEREIFPRFTLGESLTPGSVAVLDALDLGPVLEDRYLASHGVTLSCSRSGRTQRFAYDEAFTPVAAAGYQVPRADFDDLLLKTAVRFGATAHMACEVEDVLFEQGRARGVRARFRDGHTEGFLASVIVDATGRDTLIAARKGETHPLDGLDRGVLSAHFQRVNRHSAPAEGDTDIVLSPHGWVWNVPFDGEVNSVGAVCSAAWLAARGRGESLEAFFARTIDDAEAARTMLSAATRLTPVRAASQLAFSVEHLAGDGWVAVGDAAGFVDPLFSSGTHLAITGGAEAARVITDALGARDFSAARFDAYARRVSGARDLYLGAVRAFYSGDLSDEALDARGRAARQPFASLVAGDVMGDDPPWRAECRARWGLQSG
ncbi:MAG: tryptophan 7-halogenase [Myxococcales bacterium]|nr:tryptophan 7-halogenase [Myxococcales bacterium]